MRNLKRVLSLAMASVMLLGMMVIGAGAADKTAADLTDIDKVTNKEAVNLMVDLGIIVGKPDGSFAPAETIDRATMSKLIYFIMMGTADESPFKGINTGLTDVKGNWAEGFINYCYSVNIVAGTGDKTYNPNGKVTTVAAAKMLLVALGYDPVASKYQNDSMWSINIMRDAQKAGLLEDINQTASQELTRDNAAQMIFNALFADTVVPKFQYDMGVKYLDGYDSLGTTLGKSNYSLVKVTGTVTGISSGKATLANVSVGDVAVSVTGTAVNAALPAAPDMINSKVTLYVKGSVSGATLNVQKIYSTALTVTSSNTLATVYGNDTIGTAGLTALLVTAKTKVADLETGKSETANTGATALTYYYNGAPMTAGAADGGAIDTVGDAQLLVGKRGVVVEFKNTNNVAGVDTVVITEKKVATLAAAPVLGTDSTGKDVVTVSSLGITRALTSTVKGYEDLAKNDVVLYVTIGGVTYIEKASSVSGVVTGLKNGTDPKIGDTFYKTAVLVGASNTWNADYTNTYTFYLDQGNNILKTVKETDENTSNYILALEHGWVAGTGALGESNYAQARIIKSDGTSEIVTVDSVDGTDLDASGDENLIVTNEFYSYTVTTKGAYELTTISSTNVAATSITKGNAKFDGTTVGNANTIFLVRTGTAGSYSYKAYTGIANVPSMTLGATTDGVVVLKNNVATHVYLDASTGTLAGSTGDLVYITSSSFSYVPKNGDVPAHFVYTAIVNGEKTTVKVNSTTSIVNNGGGTYNQAIASKVLYEVKGADDNKIASKLDIVTTETGINYSAGTLVSSTTVATTNSATKVFYIDADGGVTALTVDAIKNDNTDKVFVVTDNDGVAEEVYIIETESAAKALLNITYTVNNGTAVTPNPAVTATGVVKVGANTEAGKTVVITGVSVSPEATWTVSGTALVAADGAGAAANQITITVTPEDGSAPATYVLTFEANA